MPVIESDLNFYGSANMPDADGATTGGAVDMTKQIVFNDITPAGLVHYVSSSASDTVTQLTAHGRDGTGAIVSENKTLTGTTKVAGTQSFERLLKGLQSSTANVGDIAIMAQTLTLTGRTAQGGSAAVGSVGPYIQLQSGDGASVAVGQIIRITNNSPGGVQFQLRRIIRLSGDFAYVNRAWGTVPTSATQYEVAQGMLFELSPNRVVEVRRPFYNAASDIPGGSTRNYYEKIFAVNNQTVTALTVAQITKLADPSAGDLQFALTNALNDTATVANRQTVPGSGITAFSAGSAPQSINVPSPQNLPPGAAPNAAGAQGIWLRLQLTAGLAAAKTSFQMRSIGQST